MMKLGGCADTCPFPPVTLHHCKPSESTAANLCSPSGLCGFKIWLSHCLPKLLNFNQHLIFHWQHFQQQYFTELTGSIKVVAHVKGLTLSKCSTDTGDDYSTIMILALNQNSSNKTNSPHSF